MKIWEPKPPGTLWATPGLLWNTFTFSFISLKISVQISVLYRRIGINLGMYQFIGPNLRIHRHITVNFGMCRYFGPNLATYRHVGASLNDVRSRYPVSLPLHGHMTFLVLPFYFVRCGPSLSAISFLFFVVFFMFWQ